MLGANFTAIVVLTSVVITFVVSAATIVYLYVPTLDPDDCISPTNSTHIYVHPSQLFNSSSSSVLCHPSNETQIIPCPTCLPSACPAIPTCPPTSSCPTCPPSSCPTSLPCPLPPSGAAQPQGILLSAYLGEKADQQRGYNVQRDNFQYISNYYNSVKRFGIKAVIFHDAAVSDDFAKKYTTENISFLRQNINDPEIIDWGNYHLKFEFAYRYLKANYYPYAMITDLSDVVFLGNVFKWMDATTESFDLYVGSEPGAGGAWDWVYGQMMGCWKTNYDIRGPIFYNAGIIGGKYEHLMTLLQVFHDEFVKTPNNICDMATLFRYIYKDIANVKDKPRIMTGLPLHKEFRRGDSDPNFAFIKHK